MMMIFVDDGLSWCMMMDEDDYGWRWLRRWQMIMLLLVLDDDGRCLAFFNLNRTFVLLHRWKWRWFRIGKSLSVVILVTRPSIGPLLKCRDTLAVSFGWNTKVRTTNRHCLWTEPPGGCTVHGQLAYWWFIIFSIGPMPLALYLRKCISLILG